VTSSRSEIIDAWAQYIDTSAYTVRRYPTQLAEYLRAHGASKVLFGTNRPMIAPRVFGL